MNVRDNERRKMQFGIIDLQAEERGRFDGKDGSRVAEVRKSEGEHVCVRECVCISNQCVREDLQTEHLLC
jgi:hypothetical protein